MYHNILAAVNEHSNSEVAARYAIHLAKEASAGLTLMFVAGAQVGVEVIRQAEAALERLFLEAGDRQVEVETFIKKGDPLQQIKTVVRDKAIDLVFSATRRENVQRRYFVKSLSRQLMLQLPCSVAMVRVVHPGKIFPQKILVPFRGRPVLQDEKAFFVARLASAFGAQVTLFHAPESLAGFFRGSMPISPQEPLPPLPPEMKQFTEYLEEHRIAYQKRLGFGPPGRAITQEAAIHHDDLIIMGASERGLWESLVGGNPLEQVLRETPCESHYPAAPPAATMNIPALPAAEVFRTMLTSAEGLSQVEAEKRLQEYGPNEITERRQVPLYRRFLAQFTHFLAVLLWLAAALCFLSDYFRPGEGLLSLGLAILAVIFINAFFTFIQEYRAEKAIQALKALLPYQVKVIREGNQLQVPAREVVPGDLLLLEAGDKVPADSRLVEANLLSVNNAPLTGESDLKSRSAEPFNGDYLDSLNLVFAGTLTANGSGRAVALATGMATEFGKIAHLTSGVEPGFSPLQREIQRVTRIVAVIAVTLGLSFFGLGFLIGRGFWHNFFFAIGIIIANVPEGLLPTVTLALAMGSQRMAKRQALIKNLNSVETLGSVTVICSDKTGTLTQNRMAVNRLWVPELAKPDGDGPARTRLLTIAGLCNNARFDQGAYVGDPTETALLQAAREAGNIQGERQAEIPFDSERKRMTTVNRVDGETLVLTKGALETVLPLCRQVFLDGQAVSLDETQKEKIQAAYDNLTDEGLRVMAFAFRKVDSFTPHPDPLPGREGKIEHKPYGIGDKPASVSNPVTAGADWEQDLVFTGLAGLADPPRPEVPQAIAKCQKAGIRVLMLTGDAGRTAVAIARQIGLTNDDPKVLEGPVLETLSDRELQAELDSGRELIFARLTPRHKMRLVSLLKKAGETVAVTGDGVNDAPALKKADIGIAMGLIGTDVAREAADMVLLDDNFATIVNAVEEGRGVFDNIRKFISYIFASNIPEIVPYIAFVLFNIPLPLTIMQILAVDLGTDMLPALALGAEPPSPQVMQQPPRGREEKLLNYKILARAYFFLGPIEAAAGLFGFFYVLHLGGWVYGQPLASTALLYLQATTACLAGIIVTQIANVFACRSFTESVFSLGLFSNRLILWGIASEILLALAIVYHPWGNRIFGTAPLALHVWLILIPFAVALLLAEEVRKLVAARI